MKRQSNTAMHLIRFGAFALVLLAPQIPSVRGYARPSIQGGVNGPCSILIRNGDLMPMFMLDTQSKDPACKAAIPALRVAAVLVIGETNDIDINRWLADVADSAWKSKFEEGLKFSDALAFLKKRIAESGEDRAKAIDNAFIEVYGRPSKPEQQAYWETQVKAQKAWYATITGALMKEVQSEPLKKQLAIIRAYQAAMGREPTVADGQYWQTQSHHYRLVREAARAYLYSPNGAKDLAETVARALQAKTGNKPSDAEVKKAMAKFTDKQLIYVEMVKN